jgi:hypothetical protein
MKTEKWCIFFDVKLSTVEFDLEPEKRYMASVYGKETLP